MPALDIGRPQNNEYAPFYARYISQVPEEDPVAVMEAQAAVTRAALRQVSESDSLFRYAPGKWSIKEVVGHLADAERVFAYRALRFARCDETPLQGFEENDYVRAANFDRIPFTELMQQLADLRRSTVALFRGLEEEAWGRRGTASGNPFTVRALAFVIPGHERHHLRVLQERYGVKAE
ncbi:MAG TPA: DinB family protein [Gemmatimonadales bacterium]|jgi:hypothetical protein|nr:DinB family protein [Gemmatimonadales bacterium]